MLTAIIADDEPQVRLTLMQIFPWEENNVRIIGEATDGEDAYRQCLEKKPDILITDIAMPKMDGIELSKKIKLQIPDIRIIFFGDIRDLDSVKTSMDIDEQDYFFKPFRIRGVSRAVKKVILSLAIEKQAKEIEAEWEKNNASSQKMMESLFLTEWASGCYVHENHIRDKLRHFGIDELINSDIYSALLCIDDFHNLDYTDVQRRQYISNSVRITIDEQMKKKKLGLCFNIAEDRFVLIFSRNNTASNQRIAFCKGICNKLNSLFQINSHVGIGRWVNSLARFPSSINEAEIALDSAIHRHLSAVVDISDVDQMTGSNRDLQALSRMVNQETDVLIAAIRRGDSANCSVILGRIFQVLRDLPHDQFDMYKCECFGIASSIIVCVSEFNKRIDEIFESNLSVFSSLIQCRSRAELYLYMKKMVTSVGDYFEKRNKQKENSIVKEITDIIKQTFTENISITLIAEQVHLTPNYVSMIFKKTCGMTIMEYVTELRIQKAKELITTTDMRIQEIAECVGYNNQYYFSSVFKKKTGVQPKNYRR